jgi:hypothetical protein
MSRCSWFLFAFLLSSASAEEKVVREMFTDRPDITESPHSVVPGMFQVEMSFFDYERDGNRGLRQESWIFSQVNLKYGLATNSDLQLVFDVYGTNRSWEDGTRDRISGPGDVTLRFKQTLWGNDSGRTSLALMPFVTAPTGGEMSADAWSGGIVMPFAMTLTEKLGLGLMGQMDLASDGETNGHDAEWLVTCALGYEFTDRWGGYTELVASWGEDRDSHFLSSSGITFAVTDDMVLDAGFRLGLNRAAPDLGIFTGMSIRF